MALSLFLRSGMFIDVCSEDEVGGVVPTRRCSSLPPLDRGRNPLFTQDEEYTSNLSAKWQSGISLSRKLNSGSVGHPHYCRNPCLFFSSQECTRGNSCGFCHICPGGLKPNKFDSINKKTFKQMDRKSREALIANVVYTKLSGLDLGPAGIQHVQEWRRAVGSPVHAESVRFAVQGIEPRSVKRVLRNLHGLNLNTICAIARTMCRGSATAEATEHLVNSLRLV